MSGEIMLSARAHAYLFGVIAREVIDAFEEPGMEAIAQGVIRYGQQRGKRMAERTRADGFEPSELNYVAYGEWSAEPGEMDFTIPAKKPDIQLYIQKCPWCEVWQENGLLEKYGYLYCKYVDVAIAQGYNPSIQFDVLECRGLGGAVCDMRLRNSKATPQAEVELASRIRDLSNKAKMPWDYHCAHLFKVLWEEVSASFGFAGLMAMQNALIAFNAVYGSAAGNAVLALMKVNFDKLPPYAGTGSEN